MIPTHNNQKALVVLSGGQDSTTCLYWALYMGYDVHAVTFNYGQRHSREIACAIKIAQDVGIAHKHEVIDLGMGILKGTSPLVNFDEQLEQYPDHHSLPGGLEKTFVPMRNQLFLTVAANRAYVIGARILITGVCQEDSGGYPDCRQVFINEIQDACNSGTFTGRDWAVGNLKIITPLMNLTKAKSVQLALSIRGCYAALAYTHTSYVGNYPPIGKDHATLLRAKGFEESGAPDPLVLRAVSEGLMEYPVAKNYEASNIESYNIFMQEKWIS